MDANFLHVVLHLVAAQVEAADQHCESNPARAVQSAGVAAGLLDFIGHSLYQFSDESTQGIEGLWTRKRLEGLDIADRVCETILQNVDSSELRSESNLWVALCGADPALRGEVMTDRQRVAMLSLNGRVRLNTRAIRFGPLSHTTTWYGVWELPQGRDLLESGQIDDTDMTIVGVNTLEIAPGGLVCPV